MSNCKIYSLKVPGGLQPVVLTFLCVCMSKLPQHVSSRLRYACFAHFDSVKMTLVLWIETPQGEVPSWRFGFKDVQPKRTIRLNSLRLSPKRKT